MTESSVMRIIAACGLLAWASQCRAYRPYDSTDADVADDKEVEIEMGWRRTEVGSDDESGLPMVFNLGIGHDRELNLEGEFTQSSVVDVRLALKQVHRRGALQGETGVSVGSECGVFIPTTGDDHGAGAECTLLASQAVSMLILHAHAGVKFNTQHRWENSIGAILEGPSTWQLKPGLEVLREAAEGEDADLSMLAGITWKAAEGWDFDVAYRHGLGSSSEIREWRIGLTWSH